MGTAASGSAVKLYYAVEDSSGVLQPGATTPAWTPIRFNTESLSRTTEQVDSEEINQSRQRTVSEQGTYSVAGNIAGEIYYGSIDGLLAALLQASWSADSVIVGSTPPRIAILKHHSDLNIAYLYRGCRVSAASFAFPLNRPAGYDFSIVGESEEKYTIPVGSTYNSVTSTQMMVTNKGSFTETLGVLDYITDYNISVSNSMNPLNVLYQRGAYAVENGVLTVSGTMTALFPSAALYDEFLGEDTISHATLIEDIAGNTLLFSLPECQYTQASKPTTGPAALQPSFTFSAGFDGTTTIQITRNPI